MKHASANTLESLATLLASLQKIPGLVERKPGIFYVKSKAYLHFHDDPAGIFADVKLDDDEFARFSVNTKKEQENFVKIVARNRGVSLEICG